MSVYSPLQIPLPQTLRRSYPVAPALSGGWTPTQLWAQTGWRQDASWAELVDLMQAVRETMHLPVEALGGVQRPAVEALAQRIRKELHQGSGVVWLRGLEGLPEPVLRRAYALLSSRIGKPIDTYGRQYDVRDSGQSHLDLPIPVSQTRAETSFHTDSSSILVEPAVVGLLCIRPAKAGGSSLVSSLLHAHSQLDAASLQLLYRDYVRNIVTPGLHGADVFKNRFPIFRWSAEEGLVARYMRYWIEKGHERLGWPLTAAEVQAMDRLDATLSANQLSFDLGTGDMVWVNNRTVAHNRTAYEDDPAKPRLLVRMWLTANPG